VIVSCILFWSFLYFAFLLEFNELGAITILLSKVFNSVKFDIIINLVQGYIEEAAEHGIEC
jgi:hypothetical protein